MKNILLLLLMVGIFSSCSMEDVPEGHRGLAVKRPYFFGGSGVELLQPDIHAIAWSTSVINVPVTPYTISENFDDMKTKDEEVVDFAVHIKFRLQDAGLPELYSNFGLEWYKNNIRESFRTDVRDLCKNYSQSELTSNPAVSREISDILNKAVTAMLKQYNIPSAECLSIEMGKVNPPKEVIDQIAQTAVQKQRKKTEDARAEAESSRKEAEGKRAEADKEYQIRMGFTSDQYLRDKSIQIDKDIVDVAKSNPNIKMLLNVGGNKPLTTVGIEK